MGLSEISMIMLVYGGLFLFISQIVTSNNKLLVWIKSVSLFILYAFISATIWFTYRAEEYHINSHSGYETISFTGEAILMIVGFSIYNAILLLLSIFLKRKRRSINLQTSNIFKN